jgi:hypothetical protein
LVRRSMSPPLVSAALCDPIRGKLRPGRFLRGVHTGKRR